MAGFFPHTGLSNPGYATHPTTTFATLLDDIVGDISTGGAGGVNGWTLYDDQRGGGGETVWSPRGGAFVSTSYGYGTFTNNSSNVGWQYQNYSWYRTFCQPGLTPISTNGTDWYTVQSFVNDLNITLNRSYTGPSGPRRIYTQLGGYIVLRCISAQKNFFVKISRTMDYLCPVRMQTFEFWNSTTHTGTNGGPQELMRAYDWPLTPRKGAQTGLQYILWLLPDAFILYLGAAPFEALPNSNMYSDLFYAGNLKTYRQNDTDAVIQACSCQNLSGMGAINGAVINDVMATNAGAVCLRNLARMPWRDPVGMTNDIPSWNAYGLWPRGMSYIFNPERALLDDAGKIQLVELDAYHTGTSIPWNTGFQPGYESYSSYGPHPRSNEGRRGELRYLKIPVGVPMSMNLMATGPAEDGNTYISIRVSRPWTAEPPNLEEDCGYTTIYGGFGVTTRYGNLGDLVPANWSTTINHRYFLLPTNL